MTKDRLKKLWTGIQAWVGDWFRPIPGASPYISLSNSHGNRISAETTFSEYMGCSLGHALPYRSSFMDVRADLDRLSGARPGSLITVAPNPRCEYCGGRPGAKERCGNCGAPNGR